MNEDEIQKFMDKHSELFENLANNIMCPACKKIASPPFFNLGKKYNWAEGHEACIEKSEK